MEDDPADGADSFDEAVLRELLAFEPDCCSPPSPLLSEATSASASLPRSHRKALDHKTVKRSARRAKLRPSKLSTVEVRKEDELDPCDFLELGAQLNNSRVKDTVNEIKGRLKAIEEGISQAKQVLQTFITRKAGVRK